MKKNRKTYSNFLAEAANRFMPEDEEIEDDEVVIDDEDGNLDDIEMDDDEVEIEDGEEEEEIPTIPVADAIKAIQSVINGDAETAEEALEMVQDSDGDYDGDVEDDELEGDEETSLEDDEIEECNSSPVDEEEEIADEEVFEDDDELDQYGESHSMFLKMSQRYL